MSATVPTPGDPIQVALGERFRKAREARGLTLAVLAERTGFTINKIRWHEAGDTMLRADDIADVAQMLGVSPGFLVGDRASSKIEKAIVQERESQ